MKRYYLFFVLMTIAGLAAIATTYWLRRDVVYDDIQSDDLRTISAAVDAYYFSKNQLPSALKQTDISDANTVTRLPRYEYRPVSKVQYELCATFKTKRGTATSRPRLTTANVPYADDPDVHDVGRQCFTYVQTAPFKLQAADDGKS